MAGTSTSPPATAFSAFIEKRRARYTAQALQVFEEQLEVALKRRGLREDTEIKAAIDLTKAVFRRKLQDLASDAIDAMTITGLEMRTNDLATEIAATLSDDDKGAATT